MSKDNAEDIVRRAAAAFNAGRGDEAKQLCEQGLRRRPGEPVLSHFLAAVLYAESAIAPARVHIEKSLTARPDNAPARLLAARIAGAAKEFDAALTHLDRAIALRPQRDVFVEKARMLELAGRKAQAREAWEAILKVIPQHQEATARLGRLAWDDGDLANAVDLLERATASDAPASVWFDLGVARQDQRDHGGAAHAYRKVLELKPHYAEAALNLGIALQDGGNSDAAMRAFAQAYGLRPQMFGSIAMALTSASHGRLWLDEDALRRALV
ncbi:tetratricopeptide repeat protein [Bradyrhizobium genosp. P]|uniref:tetratricopeptide repeat protein n=1 Tax=Bradyrhizobium genosp. P TaxID=83641 RepID=UPI003CF6EC39